MVSVAEAKAALREALAPLPNEIVGLERAPGRILAEPVVAAMSQPPFAASAMDGFAVRLDDVRRAGARLTLVGLSSAGARYRGHLAAGQAVRIYTGAPVPVGADHILIQEDADCRGEEIVVTRAQSAAQNVRPLGIDFRAGEALLEPGALLTGPALALAAAANAPNVCVRRRPRVALIANGDELILPGQEPGPDQVVCSIPYGLAPMIESWGGEAAFLGVAADDRSSIRQLAQEALAHDLIVPIGGASVGDRDFMRVAFAELGYRSVFEKVSVKPGKPAWFGFAASTPVLGLPGNPASALVTAILFVKIAIGAFLGRAAADADPVFTARAETALAATGPRETYLRARLLESPDGIRLAQPFDNQDSSLLSVFAQADVLIRRLQDAPAAPAGAVVDCVPVRLWFA